MFYAAPFICHMILLDILLSFFQLSVSCISFAGDVLVQQSSTEYHASSMMEIETNHEDADKINCGSPIVISCTELPQIENAKEGDGSSLDQDAPSSVDKEASKVVSVVADPEITKAASEGKSFTFDVPSSTDFSSVEASKKWLPFPSVDGLKSSLVSAVVFWFMFASDIFFPEKCTLMFMKKIAVVEGCMILLNLIF